MKQTAVEFLVDNFHYYYSTKWDDILEQAKEIEKKDILYFGAKCCIKTTEKKHWTLEKLYNEIFKNK
tara:strand:+ start:1226 stop:1426 length:201 start_codon:yes stop_codon:yes gene_type:complete